MLIIICQSMWCQESGNAGFASGASSSASASATAGVSSFRCEWCRPLIGQYSVMKPSYWSKQCYGALWLFNANVIQRRLLLLRQWWRRRILLRGVLFLWQRWRRRILHRGPDPRRRKLPGPPGVSPGHLADNHRHWSGSQSPEKAEQVSPKLLPVR